MLTDEQRSDFMVAIWQGAQVAFRDPLPGTHTAISRPGEPKRAPVPVQLVCIDDEATGELACDGRLMPQFRVHFYRRGDDPTMRGLAIQALDPDHAKLEACAVLGWPPLHHDGYFGPGIIVEANPLGGILRGRRPSANWYGLGCDFRSTRNAA